MKGDWILKLANGGLKGNHHFEAKTVQVKDAPHANSVLHGLGRVITRPWPCHVWGGVEEYTALAVQIWERPCDIFEMIWAANFCIFHPFWSPKMLCL